MVVQQEYRTYHRFSKNSSSNELVSSSYDSLIRVSVVYSNIGENQRGYHHTYTYRTCTGMLRGNGQ